MPSSTTRVLFHIIIFCDFVPHQIFSIFGLNSQKTGVKKQIPLLNSLLKKKDKNNPNEDS